MLDLNSPMSLFSRKYSIYVRFVGQGHWSNVKDMRLKNVQWDDPLSCESLVHEPAKEEAQEYNERCFQHCVCSFVIEIFVLSSFAVE